MCKVYNPIGSLTTIKSHLREHNINEYKSLKELIDFQKNYSVVRQQIIFDYKLSTEQEKNTLSDDIVLLENSIKAQKTAVEQKLLSELEKLKNQLDNLLLAHSGVIQELLNYFKKVSLKQKIKIKKSTFDFPAIRRFHLRIKYACSPLRQCILFAEI